MRTNHKRERKNLYRLKKEARTIRGPYIEAIEANFAGEYTTWESALKEPLRVQRLYIRQSGKHIPSEIGRCVNLRHVYLRGGSWHSLPDEIGNLRNLESLNISQNKLVNLPSTIGQLRKLRSLDVSFNHLRHLPLEVGNLERLTELNLAGNKLETLPETIGNLTRLQFLSLLSNEVASLPDSIGNLSALRRLHLFHNRLENIPVSVGNLTELRDLFLGFNKLLVLPETLGKCTKLQQLDVSQNQLCQLPESIGNLTTLTSLTAGRNQIEKLPQVLSRLTLIEYLYLSENRLTALPDGLGSLSKLHTLLANDNQLVRLPESIGQLTQLKTLNVSQTPHLVSLGAAFQVRWLEIRDCTSLRVLPADLNVTSSVELGNTALLTFPESFYRVRLLWNRIPVDERIVMRPETITVDEVFKERNVERRRVLIERIGHERFMREAKPEVLHRDRDRGGRRRLLRVVLDHDEPLVYLNVTDPSTGREYLLRVPPTMRTCRQAAAWIAGFDNPAQYHPLKET